MPHKEYPVHIQERVWEQSLETLRTWDLPNLKLLELRLDLACDLLRAVRANNENTRTLAKLRTREHHGIFSHICDLKRLKHLLDIVTEHLHRRKHAYDLILG